MGGRTFGIRNGTREERMITTPHRSLRRLHKPPHGPSPQSRGTHLQVGREQMANVDVSVKPRTGKLGSLTNMGAMRSATRSLLFLRKALDQPMNKIFSDHADPFCFLSPANDQNRAVRSIDNFPSNITQDIGG